MVTFDDRRWHSLFFSLSAGWQTKLLRWSRQDTPRCWVSTVNRARNRLSLHYFAFVGPNDAANYLAPGVMRWEFNGILVVFEQEIVSGEKQLSRGISFLAFLKHFYSMSAPFTSSSHIHNEPQPYTQKRLNSCISSPLQPTYVRYRCRYSEDFAAAFRASLVLLLIFRKEGLTSKYSKRPSVF